MILLLLQLVQSFQRGNHSCFLYLAGVLVDVFGELPDCRPGLVGLFEVTSRFLLISFKLAIQVAKLIKDCCFR